MKKIKKQKAKVNPNPRKLSDEVYQGVLTVHQPLLARVISKYKEEKDNRNLSTIVVFGDYSLPLAVEFAQWCYDTTYVAQDKQDFVQASRDARRFGIEFHKITQEEIPGGKTVIVFIEKIEKMKRPGEIRSFLNSLTGMAEEVIFSVKSRRKWDKLLEQFDYTVEQYPANKRRVLISLKKKALLPAGKSQDQQLGDEPVVVPQEQLAQSFPQASF